MGDFETGIRIRTIPDSQRNASAIRLLVRFVDLNLISVNFNSTVMLMVHWYRYRYQTIKRPTFKNTFLCSVGVFYLKRQMSLDYHKVR